MSKPFLQRCLEPLSRLSLSSMYRLGDLLALLLRLVPNQVSRQTRLNIRLCFGDLVKTEQLRLYRESLRHTCYTMTELAAVWCWPVDRVLERITSQEICAEFGDSRRGRIVIAPHLGSWETLALWLGRQGTAMFLYKRPENRALDAYIRSARGRSGGEAVPTKRRGLRKLLVGIRDGGSLMILPDQKPGGNKAYIDSTLFGKNAPTTTLVHNLCNRLDCDVFIAAICRSSPVGEFSLRIRPLEHARLAADKIASAQYMNDQIEAMVRERPEQYQWGYRRFASREYASVN